VCPACRSVAQFRAIDLRSPDQNKKLSEGRI
jgi:hypothetical protein